MISLCGAAAAAVNGIRKIFCIRCAVQFFKCSAQERVLCEMAVDRHWLAELGTLFISVKENGTFWTCSGMSY
jgi:hypothetical protein